MTAGHGSYYIPNPSPWPIITMAALLCLMIGLALSINGFGIGWVPLAVGLALLARLLYGWFGDVVHENLSGRYIV